MARWLALLGRYARPLLLISGVLLLAGLMLTGFNLLMIGWSLYAAGYVASILAFKSYAAANRERMDGWAWTGLAVLLVGLVIGLVPVASIWNSYAQAGWTGAMQLPLDAAPLGLLAELVTWVGLAFYGLAARGARALPTVVAWAFVVAAVIGVLSAFRIIAPLWWLLAVVIVALSLQWLGAVLAEQARSRNQATAVSGEAA